MEQKKINRERLALQHIQERKERKERDKQTEKKSFEDACKQLSSLIKDTRYQGYKYLLTTRMDYARARRDALRNTVKTNDEYLRLALILDTEISIIREILEVPDTFIKRLNELKEEESRKKEG